MVLTRTLETASTGRFLTIYFFLHFLGSEPEPAEPEPAESGVVTEPLEPNRLDQEPTRTEPNRPFPAFCLQLFFFIKQYQKLINKILGSRRPGPLGKPPDPWVPK